MVMFAGAADYGNILTSDLDALLLFVFVEYDCCPRSGTGGTNASHLAAIHSE